MSIDHSEYRLPNTYDNQRADITSLDGMHRLCDRKGCDRER